MLEYAACQSVLMITIMLGGTNIVFPPKPMGTIGVEILHDTVADFFSRFDAEQRASLPKIVFLGYRRSNASPFMADITPEVLKGLPDNFTFKPVSQSILRDGFMANVTDRATGERGLRMLFGQITRDGNVAHVSVELTYGNGWCGYGTNRLITSRYVDGTWRMVEDR
jgi:hypothetical protein